MVIRCLIVRMKQNMPRSKRAGGKLAQRRRGRPQVEDPRQNVSIRFNSELLAELDAWGKDHGGLDRSSVVRLAVSDFLKGRTEKAS